MDLANDFLSHDTFSRVSGLLDTESVAQGAGRYPEAGASGAPGGIMAVDAKTLRRPYDVAAKRSPLEAVTVFSAEGGVVLGEKSCRSGDGDSEITSARALLACLDPRGVLVTGDAIHCQDRHGLEPVMDQASDDPLALEDKCLALHSEGRGLFETALRPGRRSADDHRREPLVGRDLASICQP